MLKLIWKSRNPQMASTIFKINKGRNALLEMKTYKAIIIETGGIDSELVWSVEKDKVGTYPWIYGNLIYNHGGVTH